MKDKDIVAAINSGGFYDPNGVGSGGVLSGIQNEKTGSRRFCGHH